MKDIILYLDIPFCPVHCRFCGRSAWSPRPDLRTRYAQALRAEVRSSAGSLAEYEVKAVYVGGGIAGHMFDEELGSLLHDMASWYPFTADTEITLKVHPGMVSAETMEMCRRARVGRLSVEYVTGNVSEYEQLGRFLNPSAMDVTREVIGRYPVDVSFDLVAGLPGQSERSLLENVDRALSCGAKHVSLYPFVLQEGTALAAEDWSRQADNPRRRLPDKKEVQGYLAAAGEKLAGEGFAEYLPGRFALPGKECRFFMREAAGCECLAFGPGTESRLDGIMSRNTEDADLYLRHSDDPEQIVTHFEVLEETGS